MYSNWEELPFIEPFPTPDAFAETDGKTRRLANQLALQWAEDLNRRHDRDYSPAYWRTLLILWLVAAVQATWRRYRHMELLADRYREIPLTVEILDETPNWRFSDFQDFQRHLFVDTRFDFWMTSCIARAIAPPAWTLIPVASNRAPEERFESERTPERHSMLVRLVRLATGRLRFDSILGVRTAKLPLSIYLNLLPKRAARRVDHRDDEAILGEFPEAYHRFIGHFLEHTLPRSWGDRYLDLEAQARRHRYVAGRLFVDHMLSLDDRRRTVIAQAQEAGERLVGCQHGSSYGSGRTEPWAAEGEYRHHAFVTWGWDRQAELEGRMVPLPSPFLGRFRDKHRFKDERLIFVGAWMFIRSLRFDPCPTPNRWLIYRRMKRQFIDSLDDGAREALWYRPHLNAPETIEDVEYLDRFFPGLRILEGALNDRILDCRLLVLDYPSTALNIAMAANAPLVCYWDRDSWPLCHQAEPFFDELRRCGILHDGPQQAAAHINRIWHDIPDWLYADDVQAARRRWCHRFARTGRAWWWHWAKALSRL